MKIIARAAGQYLNALAYISGRQCGAAGYKLCSYPVREKMTPHQKNFLMAAKAASLLQDQVPLQTYLWGSGPKHILFIHGWQSHSFRWKSYIESLQNDQYTIHAFDAPGHGLSGGNMLNAPLYSAAIENMLASIGPVDTIIAHSIGAFALLHALHHHPHWSVKKIIIMAAPTEANYFMDFCKQYLGLSERAMHLIREKFETEFKQPLAEFSVSKFVSTISIPALIIHDKEDVETPYRDIESVHHSWESSILLTTRGLGHKLKSPDVIQAVHHFISHPESFPRRDNDNIMYKPVSEILPL